MREELELLDSNRVRELNDDFLWVVAELSGLPPFAVWAMLEQLSDRELPVLTGI
jgi:hypothetical protein